MAKKKSETRKRGLFLDPVKVDAKLGELKMTQEQLVLKSGRSKDTVDKIWNIENMDYNSADDIAAALQCSVDELEMLNPPVKESSPPQQIQNRAHEQVKEIRAAVSALYAALTKATHIETGLIAEALDTVHKVNTKLLFVHPIPDDYVNAHIGSVVITFPIWPEDATTLMNAFIRGDLAELDIVSVKLSVLFPTPVASTESVPTSTDNSIAPPESPSSFPTRRAFKDDSWLWKSLADSLSTEEKEAIEERLKKVYTDLIDNSESLEDAKDKLKKTHIDLSDKE
jgi:transcriptional regulator with XRE-family HTH domain